MYTGWGHDATLLSPIGRLRWKDHPGDMYVVGPVT